MYSELERFEMSEENNFGKCGFCKSRNGHYFGCPKICSTDEEALQKIFKRDIFF